MLTEVSAPRRLGEDHPSLHDRVKAALAQAIRSGRLRPGERIVEERLAAEFGVSRNPVREAIRGSGGRRSRGGECAARSQRGVPIGTRGAGDGRGAGAAGGPQCQVGGASAGCGNPAGHTGCARPRNGGGGGGGVRGAFRSQPAIPSGPGSSGTEPSAGRGAGPAAGTDGDAVRSGGSGEAAGVLGRTRRNFAGDSGGR